MVKAAVKVAFGYAVEGEVDVDVEKGLYGARASGCC